MSLFSKVPQGLLPCSGQTPSQRIANFFIARRALNLTDGFAGVMRTLSIGKLPESECEEYAPQILKANLTEKDKQNLEALAASIGISKADLEAILAKAQ